MKYCFINLKYYKQNDVLYWILYYVSIDKLQLVVKVEGNGV